MKLLQVATLESARAALQSCLPLAGLEGGGGRSPAALPTETLPLHTTLNRVCAATLLCADSIPPYPRATVDGYALRALDTAAATDALPVFLRLVGDVDMGAPALMHIRPGECAYVPTGGMVPDGADACQMIEHCEPFGADGIAVYAPVASGAHVVQPGEDMAAGDPLIRAGTVVRPQHIGALAAAGIAQLPVYRPLRLALISTGDEIVPIDSAPLPGQIRDINTHALRALAERNHYLITSTHILNDDKTAIQTLIQSLLPHNDVVAVSGGSSQGAKDFTRDAFNAVASPGVFLHGLAIKPGKPTILAHDKQTGTILAGLPGHPVSAMMVFEMLFCWLARRAFGAPEPLPIPARLTEPVPGADGKLHCVPVRLLQKPDGTYHAIPAHGKSGLITTLTRADGFFTIDRNREGRNPGDTVLVHLI